MIVGVNWHAAWAFQKDAATRGKILDDMKAWGAQVVRLDYAWATIEPSKGAFSWGGLDTYVNEASSRGLKVLVMLYWPPAWASSTGSSSKAAPPKYGADFGGICGQVGKRYGSKLIGVEMWNEPDISTFWSGSRTQFFQMTKDAYATAKAISPGTTFVAAAPTYIGLASNWFRDAYASGIYKGSYDAQAIHPYMSPSDLPATAPATNWSINGIANLKTLRANAGDVTPLWATEFGWSTHSNAGGEANYKRGVTEANQAVFTKDAFALMTQLGVAVATVYTDVDMSQTADVQERCFGMERVDYSKKPVVAALASVYAGTPPIVTLPPVEPPPVVTEPPVVQPPKDSSLVEVQARIADLEDVVLLLGKRVDAMQVQVTTLNTNYSALKDDVAKLYSALTVVGDNLVQAGEALQ